MEQIKGKHNSVFPFHVILVLLSLCLLPLHRKEVPVQSSVDVSTL